MAAEFELYEDQANPSQYRWRLQSRNDKIIADSAQGYVTKAGVKEGIADVKRLAPERAHPRYDDLMSFGRPSTCQLVNVPYFMFAAQVSSRHAILRASVGPSCNAQV